MKFVFLIFDAKTAKDLSPEESADMFAFIETARGVAEPIYHQALAPAATANVVAVREGKTITTDGPFVETKEQLGGFFVFDCESLEVALALAARIPRAASGHIEVRGVIEFPVESNSG